MRWQGWISEQQISVNYLHKKQDPLGFGAAPHSLFFCIGMIGDTPDLSDKIIVYYVNKNVNNYF